MVLGFVLISGIVFGVECCCFMSLCVACCHVVGVWGVVICVLSVMSVVGG